MYVGYFVILRLQPGQIRYDIQLLSIGDIILKKLYNENIRILVSNYEIFKGKLSSLNNLC